MSTLQQQLQRSLKAQADLPCDNAEDQATHDRLKEYDMLTWEGMHTAPCALGMLWGGEQCRCKGDP